MPRVSVGPLCLLLFVSSVSCVSTAPPPPQSEERRRSVVEKMPDWMEQYRVPGVAVAKIERGKIAWIEVFGRRNEHEPVTRDTVFNVASLTKPVFAAMTLRLIAAGELDLDTSLSDYWVDPEIAGDARHRALTPRMVLSHQTGFQNWRGHEKLQFLFDPGSRHEYSGEGYEYLVKAIETKTGKSLKELMHENVLRKAGMTESSFGWSNWIGSRYATGFDESGKPYEMSSLQERRPRAASSMLTTIEDYARFVEWIIAGADLPRPLYAEMQRPQALHPDPAEWFGLGWRVVSLGKQSVLSHDGRENGVRTQVFVLPESGEGVVVLTNASHGELLIRAVAEKALVNGTELMNQVSKDTWHYLQRVPSVYQPRILKTISRSPSFVSKLLHAVDATLVANAGLTDLEEREARRRIDCFVFSALTGHIDQTEIIKVFGQLHDPERNTFRETFTADQGREWIAALDRCESPQRASTATH